jgi:KAP family P-loop domain
MAQAAGVKWEELSENARIALSWAVAAQRGHVSSRGLLIALLRVSAAPHTLLAHFGVSPESLFEALRKRVPERIIDPGLGNPKQLLEALPTLTLNAARILDRAAELHREVPTDQVDTECLFGGLLDTGGSTCYLALADVIPQVPVDQLRDSYLRWLRGNGMGYDETLERDFPRRPRATAEAESEPAAPDPAAPSHAEPWPYLAVLRRRVGSADGDEFRLAALGFLVGNHTLLTTAPPTGLSDALVPQTDTAHELSTLASTDRLTILELSPSQRMTIDAPPPIVGAESGEPCLVAAADGHISKVVLLEGVVRVDGDSTNERFVVDLAVPLSTWQTAMGSPVVNTNGEIIGVVGPTAPTRSVDALGAHAITRALVEHNVSPSPRAPPTPTAAPIAIGGLSGAGNDAVGEIDQLGFQAYVDAFADLIASPHTQPPLTIGIFGSWGMGKSFLLEHIEREINARQAAGSPQGPRVHVVRFNAWEYSAMDVVWPALVRTIVTRLDELSTWPRHKRVWTRVRWNLARQWRHLRMQLIAGALVVATAITVAIASGESSLAGVIGGVAAVLGLGGVLKAAKDPIAQWVTALFADSDYGRQLRVMEDIKHDLETLEERLHGTNAVGEHVVTGRILVLIDDLDRCEPAKAVEVLQAVNLLLNFNSFIVCLGIDARIVTGAVERHYEGLLGKAGASGYEYLDKIVQIPFRIPEPARNDIITFVAGQLGNPEKPAQQRDDDGDTQTLRRPPAGVDTDAAVSSGGADAPAPAGVTHLFQGDNAAVDSPAAGSTRDEVPFTYAEQEAFELFADYLRPNPRHLKRLVNVYRLVRSLARAQQERLILERPAATIRWLIMWSQWPYASLAMLERFEQLLDSRDDESSDNVPDSDVMLHLLDHVERAGLDPPTRERLDDDADELRKLLSVEGCGLTWDEIRRIRRFTVNFNPAVEEQVRLPTPPPPPLTDIGTARRSSASPG